MPWFWAAYRLGALDGTLRELSEKSGIDVTDPGKDDLPEIVAAWFSFGDFWVFTAPTKKGMSPIGVVGGEYFHNAFIPFALWFPWATPRGKLECAARFLEDMRKKHTVLIYSRYDVDPETKVPGPEEKFFRKMAYLGLITKGCRIENVFGAQDCSFWKSVE